jgi:hypothetical protein
MNSSAGLYFLNSWIIVDDSLGKNDTNFRFFKTTIYNIYPILQGAKKICQGVGTFINLIFRRNKIPNSACVLMRENTISSDLFQSMG